MIQKYWITVFVIVLLYSLILSFIPLMPTATVYPDQNVFPFFYYSLLITENNIKRFGHYGHFHFPFCEIIGPVPVIVLSTAPVLLGILICIAVFSIAIGRFLYLISGQKKNNRMQS